MHFRPRFGRSLKRPIPGVWARRWLLLLFVGITVVSLGVGYIPVDVFRTSTLPSSVNYLTMELIPRTWRGLRLGVTWVAATAIAVVQLHSLLLSGCRVPGQSSLADIICKCGRGVRRPTVVVMGGGTRLSAPSRTAAVVPTVCNVLWDYCQMEQSHSRKRHSISRPVRLWRLLCCRKTSGRPRFFL